jgi:Lon protease-like protein
MRTGNRRYNAPTDLPEVIPVFPLSAALLLPRAELPLNIFEPRYLAMVDQALGRDRVIGMVQPDEQAPDGPTGPALLKVGCAGRITSFAETGDGRYLIKLTGIARFKIVEEVESGRQYRSCRVTASCFASDFADGCDAPVDRSAVLRTFRAYLKAHNLDADWESVGQASNETLINTLAMIAPFDAAAKQALLEAPDLRARAETLVAITELTLAAEGGRPLQ